MNRLSKNLEALLENHEAPTKDRARYMLLAGGTRSGKTFACLEYLVQCAIQMPNLRCTVFRQDGRRHDSGALQDLHDILRANYAAVHKRCAFNGTTKVYTFPNGAHIRFAGAQDVYKLHGPGHDIVLLNEVNEMSHRAIEQIDMRTRLLIMADCNPVDMTHPTLEMIARNTDARTIHSTYLDNPHLTPPQIRVIEGYAPTPENIAAGTADKYLYEVYTLGMPSRREGAVYDTWEITDEWPVRAGCQRCAWGLDLGYSVDPSALVCIRLRGTDLYLREYIYETGLLVAPAPGRPDIPSISARLGQLRAYMHPADHIYADSAQPESITQLQLAGFPVIPARKGAGSILEGVNRIRRFNIKVCRCSTNIQAELRNYTWKTDIGGRFTDTPVDHSNHALDAVRYAAQEIAPLRRDRTIDPERPPIEQYLANRFKAEQRPLIQDPDAIILF